jgi:hypothetical protein
MVLDMGRREAGKPDKDRRPFPDDFLPGNDACHGRRGGRHGGMNLRLVLAGLMLLTATRAVAVDRILRIECPAAVAPGTRFQAVVVASTDAGEGEQVGMFQADISQDEGRSWAPARYLDGLGANTTQTIDLMAGAVGSTVRLRVRVAFRGGLAGDVDHRGAAIRWHETWNRWSEPPAKSVVIAVRP